MHSQRFKCTPFDGFIRFSLNPPLAKHADSGNSWRVWGEGFAGRSCNEGSPGAMECDSRVEGEAGSVDGRIYTAILSGSEALLPLIRDHWESLRSASKFSSLGLGAASRVQFVLSRGEVRVTGSSWDPLAEIAEGHVNAVGLFSGCLLYTSDAADDLTRVDLGGPRIIT